MVKQMLTHRDADPVCEAPESEKTGTHRDEVSDMFHLYALCRMRLYLQEASAEDSRAQGGLGELSPQKGVRQGEGLG